jgi:hypothetical protein
LLGGPEWNLGNPVDFVILILKKQTMYTGNHTSMIYRASERPHNDTSPLYLLLRLVSIWYWTAILILIAAAVIFSRHWMFGNPFGGLVAVTVLYVLSVHPVLASQTRNHIPLYGLMVILATTAFWRPSATVNTSGNP